MIARMALATTPSPAREAGHPPFGSSQPIKDQCGAASAIVACVRFARNIGGFVWLFGRGVPQFGG